MFKNTCPLPQQTEDDVAVYTRTRASQMLLQRRTKEREADVSLHTLDESRPVLGTKELYTPLLEAPNVIHGKKCAPDCSRGEKQVQHCPEERSSIPHAMHTGLPGDAAQRTPLSPSTHSKIFSHPLLLLHHSPRSVCGFYKHATFPPSTPSPLRRFGASRLFELLAEHEELRLIVDGEHTGTSDTTENVGTSTLEERSDTLLSHDLAECIHSTVVFDSLHKSY